MSKHKLNKSKGGDWYVLVGPYDAALVDELKRRIPSSGREWRPTSKLWRIAPEWKDEAESVIADCSGMGR
jgi:hypothetical protein